MINRDVEIAWIAGLFEGEGSFCFHKGRARSIQISSTDRDVLEKVERVLGGKVYEIGRRLNKEHWKDAYIWRLPLKNSIDFINDIKAYLGDRRTKRSEEFIKSLQEAQTKKIERNERTKTIRKLIHELRQKGLTHQAIAKELSIDRTHVTKILNSLN